jgi:hypothetical protein
VHALVQVPELLSGWQDYSGRLSRDFARPRLSPGVMHRNPLGGRFVSPDKSACRRWLLWDTLFLAAAAFKCAGEKALVPFEVVYQTDPRRSATVTLWLCFSEYEGFTVLLPEEY